MAKDINDRWVDVDFTKEPEFVFGAKPSDLMGVTFYEDSLPVLTKAEINEAIEQIEEENSGAEWLVSRCYDQGQEGACVADACSQSHEICQGRQFGIENVVHLSAMSLYKRIGRSASSGAVVRDGLEEMQKRGILPWDTPENRERFGNAVMPNTGFNNRYPADWELTAKNFTVLEYDAVRSMDGIMSALCRRHPVIVGREGHSICYTTPLFYKGKWASQYINSWDLNWGFADGHLSGGFGVDTNRQTEKSANNGAFVVRAVTYYSAVA